VGRFTDRIKHAWNAFQSPERDPTGVSYGPATYSVRPDRVRSRVGNERSIISSIYTRMSIDIAAIDVRHVRLDKNDRFEEEIDSGLNNCLKVEANIDQAARQFRQDVVLTLFDRGVVAIVPVDTTMNPSVSGSFDIKTMRVGEIVNWYPEHVRVSLFNQEKGIREDVTLLKNVVAIVENPLYGVMNEPNSTLQRIIRKLNLLDVVDEQSSSGKLDLIIQLPYVIKSEARQKQAEQRRKDIEFQLSGSKYGIAYTDGTEKITQLNRPAENNLLKQVEYLIAMLYGQLGITEAVMNGTADESAMINYYNRTVEPVLTAIIEAMRRTFLTKTARSQRQSIMLFRDLFKFVTLKDFAEISDKLTRNEVASSNDLRQVIGWKPSKDPNADKLRNSNMPQPAPTPSEPALQLLPGGNSQNGRS
jgi:putative sterol carrier protein